MLKKQMNFIKRLVTVFFLISSFIFSTVTVGVAGNTSKFKDDLSFVAIVKNEGPYIKEWIEFHKLVGVTRFYIYDNESTDNLKDILKDYIKDGTVVYKYFPGKQRQCAAYRDATNNYKNQTKYMGFIDIDEFVVPVEKQTIVDAIDEIMKKDDKIAGVGINWVVYGNSGFINKPKGLVIENYKYRAPDNYGQNALIKTICNPRLIQWNGVHRNGYKQNYYCVNEEGKNIGSGIGFPPSHNKLRINHYITKSKSEFIQKINRGDAIRKEGTSRFSMKRFYNMDRRDVYDRIMEKYVPKLKEKLGNAREIIKCKPKNKIELQKKK